MVDKQALNCYIIEKEESVRNNVYEYKVEKFQII